MYDRYEYHYFTGAPVKKPLVKTKSTSKWTVARVLKTMGVALVLAGVAGYMSQLQAQCEAEFGTNSIMCVEK